MFMRYHPNMCLLPAGLDDAGDFATHRELAELMATQPEFAVHAAWPAGQRATIAHPCLVAVAGQRLNLEARCVARFFRCLGVVDDRLEGKALLRELDDKHLALLVAIDQ